jgi:steroid delta-isomerase-like uncharacterized protein
MPRLAVLASILLLLTGVVVAGHAPTAAQDASPVASPAPLPPLLADYGAAWSSGDPAQVAKLYADDALFEEVVLGGAITHSSADLTAYVGALFAAFSDFALTPTSGFVIADHAVAEWVVTGRYTGTFGPLPAGTGQHVEFRGATVLVLANGTIQRDSEYWDLTTLLTQVGAMPGGGTPAA